MAGPNVGYATLSIIPSAKGFQAGLMGELNGPMDKAGQEAGGKFTGGMSTFLKGGLLAVGVGAAAVLTKAFGDALGAEANSDRIAASLGISEDDARELGDVAANVYRDAWGDSLAEVTDTVTALQTSFEGLTTDALEPLTAQATALGDAFGIDVAAGVQTASELVSSGLAGSAEEAFDLLTRGLQEMPQGIRDELLEASNEYGDFFADLGFSGAETFGLLTKYAEDGVYGIDKLGDALKELTIRGSDMSAASVAAYEAAGLSATEMAAAITAGGPAAREATQQIAQGLLSIEDPTARANAAIALFGTPLEDLSVAQIPEFLTGLAEMNTGLGDVEGAAQLMADTLGDNTSAKIEAFKRDALGTLADFLANNVIPAFQAVVTWTETNWPKIREAVEPVMLAIQGIITDVTALIQAIWEKWGDTITEFVTNRFQTIWDTIGGIMEAIRGVIQTVTALIQGDWAGAWEGIKMIFSGVWTAIKALALGFITEVQLLLSTAWETIRTTLSTAWDAISDFFTTTWETIKTTVSNGIEAVVGFVTGLPGSIASAVSGAFDSIYDNFKAVVNKVIDAWNGLEFPGITIPGFDPPGPGSFPSFSTPSIGFPNVPRLHSGGFVGGSRGDELLAVLQAGELVVDTRTTRMLADRVRAASQGGRSGQLFGDVYVSEQVDVDAFWQRSNAYARVA